MPKGVTISESDELFELQAVENDGCGISCIRSICVYLDKGVVDSVEDVVNNEWDKIRNYPKIAKWLKEHGYAEASWL